MLIQQNSLDEASAQSFAVDKNSAQAALLHPLFSSATNRRRVKHFISLSINSDRRSPCVLWTWSQQHRTDRPQTSVAAATFHGHFFPGGWGGREFCGRLEAKTGVEWAHIILSLKPSRKRNQPKNGRFGTEIGAIENVAETAAKW